MEKVSCPQCGGSGIEKYGKTAAGLQKYRCTVPGCRRQFTGGSDHLIDDKTKAMVMQLLAAGVEPKKIAVAVPDISLRWIYELRRRMANP